jgi:AmmeMemoRadiSam system protein B
MPLEPPDPAAPRRIIVPGDDPRPAEPAAPPAERGDAPSAGAPRIVLPPGVAPEEPEDLPEYPRLRPLEIIAIRDGDRDMLLVSDPLGVMPAPVALRIEALEMLQVLDGSLSLSDISAEVVRASKDLRAGAYVKEFVAQLDRMLMLDSPRFAAAYGDLREGYHRLEVRQAILGGHSYPEDPAELAAFVDGHFAEAERWRAAAGEPAAAPGGLPRALLAPHLDPRRAGAAIARAYLELGVEQPGPLRVVVYGTGHSLMGEAVALTRKHFETPFGQIPCDIAFVGALAGRLGDAAWRGELAHRDEHSIEFHAVYLKRRFGDRPVTLVPILCGGFHGLLDAGQGPRDDATVEALIAAVNEAEGALGGATVHVAAVDLSHVGPRFGDPAVDERTLKEVESHDRAALDAAARGDADGWYQAIAAHEDSTRVCGWGATYAMLRCADPGAGRLLRYQPSREENGSVVSVAAMVWP